MEAQIRKSNTVICGSRRLTRQVFVGVLMLLAATATVHYAPMAALGGSRDDLRTQIHELTAQIKQLRQEQSMPALVLNCYRNSIGYVYGVYHVGFANQHPEIRARVSG